jgi:hypothetical protein
MCNEDYLSRDGIGDQEDKEDLERSGENSLGQESLKQCDCGPMPPGGQRGEEDKNCSLS